MENYIPIDLHQARDFGRKMNATFEFVRQNFKSLGKSILLIAGPPVLVASLLLGSFFGDILSFSQMAGAGGNPEYFQNYLMSVSFWLQMILGFIFMLLSTVTTIATINNYIIIYDEKRTNRIDVNEVWQRVRATFWMYMGTTFLFALTGIAMYVLIIVLVVGLAQISGFLIFLGGVFLFCLFVYFMISVSLVFIVRAYERVGFFEAIGRSFKLVQGKWWSTFGLIFILYIIVVTVSYIFIIPMYVVMIVSTLHNLDAGTFKEPSGSYQILMTVFFTLYYMAQMIMYSLPNVGVAFQYFNLVERKEARGLMDQIQSIGQAPSPSAPTQDEHY